MAAGPASSAYGPLSIREMIESAFSPPLVRKRDRRRCGKCLRQGRAARKKLGKCWTLYFSTSLGSQLVSPVSRFASSVLPRLIMEDSAAVSLLPLMDDSTAVPEASPARISAVCALLFPPRCLTRGFHGCQMAHSEMPSRLLFSLVSDSSLSQINAARKLSHK